MAARKKNKKINYSTAEIDVLTSEVESNRKILFAGASSGVTNAVKTTVWARITERVNGVANVERTRREVKKKWSDLKLFTRKKESQLRRSQLLTGGRQSDPDPLFTAVDERIASILGHESLDDDPAEASEVPGGEYVLLSEEAMSDKRIRPPKEEPEEPASAGVAPPKEEPEEETPPCSIGAVWGSARLEGACPPSSAPIPPAPPAVEPASSGAGGGGGGGGGGTARHAPSAHATPQRSTQAQERGGVRPGVVSDAALLVAAQCGGLVQALAGQCDGLVQALRDINQSIVNLTQSVDRVCGQLQTSRDAEQKNPSE